MVRQASAVTINEGDFVDVMATMDIATFKGRYHIPTVKVHFVFESVIQLCDTASVPVVRMFFWCDIQ